MPGLILIVEDERDLASVLEYNIKREGFDTRVADTGAGALDVLKAEPRPALVLLDLMLPDMMGVEICRRLKQDPQTNAIPVVMLTAKGEEIDRVVGFEVGADDYIVKPFSVRELMLRIHAVLRRAQQQPSVVAPPPSSSPATSATGAAVTAPAPVSFGKLTVDEDAHRVLVDGAEVALTALEFRLLTTLLARKGRVQTRDVLLNDVWGMSADVTTRTVDTHVKRLREKLGDVAGGYIETLRGVGYRFADRLPGAPP